MNISPSSSLIRSTRLQAASGTAAARCSAESSTFGIVDTAESLDSFMGTATGKIAAGGVVGTTFMVGMALCNPGASSVGLGLIGATVGGVAGLVIHAMCL